MAPLRRHTPEVKHLAVKHFPSDVSVKGSVKLFRDVPVQVTVLARFHDYGEEKRKAKERERSGEMGNNDLKTLDL